ncbi:MAG: hypothetical protein R2850_07445 [Bacteroidia bacterium]
MLNEPPVIEMSPSTLSVKAAVAVAFATKVAELFTIRSASRVAVIAAVVAFQVYSPRTGVIHGKIAFECYGSTCGEIGKVDV